MRMFVSMVADTKEQPAFFSGDGSVARWFSRTAMGRKAFAPERAATHSLTDVHRGVFPTSAAQIYPLRLCRSLIAQLLGDNAAGL